MIDADEALERFRERLRLPSDEACLYSFLAAFFGLIIAWGFWPCSDDVPLMLLMCLAGLLGLVAAALILFALYVTLVNTLEWQRELRRGPSDSGGNELWDHWIDEYPGSRINR